MSKRTGLTGAHLLGYCIQYPTNSEFKVTDMLLCATVRKVQFSSKKHFKQDKICRVDMMSCCFFKTNVVNHSCISWSMMSLLTFITLVSNFENHVVSFLIKSCHFHQNRGPSGTERPWHEAQMQNSDSSSGLVIEKSQRTSQQPHWCGQVPTTTSHTMPFQTTTTSVGPVDLVKTWNGFWSELLLVFGTRSLKRWLTH